MNRRTILKVSISAAALCLFTACMQTGSAAKTPPKQPNIIFIMTDDHASHAMSCYGNTINQTPNLDRIAKEGMRFENCFCTNSICAPSRAVVLTGKYSHINGKIDNGGQAFDGSQQTFPKLLQQNGYQTAMIGKWHLRSDPTGFDYWNILPGQGAYHDPKFIEMGETKQYKGYTTDLITDFCIDFLKKRDTSKPFCVMYQHKAPHRNWSPNETYKAQFKDKQFPLPETFDDDYATRCDAAREQSMSLETSFKIPYDTKVEPPEGLEGRDLTVWKYQRYMQDYLACVASVDENVGRLLDFLEAENLAENTVVVYTSDQGFYLGDHGWFDKRFMYEESLRMPLLVRWPNVIKAGSVNSDIVLNLDFAETFLEMAGVTVPDDMQGQSMTPILLGKTPDDWRTSMYYHYYEYPGAHSVKRHYGIRTERYKLIHFYHDIDCWELFDLKKDPHELNNVYDDPKYADVVSDMEKQLRQLQKQYKDSDELAQQYIAETKKKKK